MSKLNKDVLLLIIEELQDDRNSLYSCLLVNRTWCKTTVPILWKNPRQKFPDKARYLSFLNVIISHLSEESRDILKNQGIDLFMSEAYQQPLFNYISFWKVLELHLDFLNSMIITIMELKNIEESIIRNEIYKIFNRNARFTHLYIE